MAHVNSILFKHNIILGLDDRGKLSCHKVHLIFINFEIEPCLVSDLRIQRLCLAVMMLSATC